LSKLALKTFRYAEVRSLKNWKLRSAEALEYATKDTSTLGNEVWALVPPELTDAYNKIIGQSIRLVDLVGEENIFNGIQTSANEVYIFTPTREDKTHYFFTKKGVEYRIEKAITKPYFQTSLGGDNLNTYRTFKPNARVVFPYTTTKTGVEVIPLATIRKNYPSAFDYLQKHKAILNSPKRDTKPEPTSSDEWHRYGRHQSLDSCGLPEKIIVGVLSVGDKYAVDSHGTLISSGGTAGYCVIAIPTESDYSIYYVQAILNSKYLEWFSALYGEVFRGGYIARGTKVLKNLPTRTIDFTDAKEKAAHDNIVKTQKALIAIFDQMDASAGNNRLLTPLQRQFKQEQSSLAKQLAALYNLGADDSAIPLIKELYEAD
jgi:hypothetical protein